MGASVTLVVPDPVTGADRQAGTTANPLVTTSSTTTGSGATASTPSFSRSVGSASIATNQVASSISPAAATQIVAARAGRQSVTFTNITGTQPVFFVASAATTGATTGFFLAGSVGASVTISTAAAVFATSPTAAQTIGVLETF